MTLLAHVYLHQLNQALLVAVEQELESSVEQQTYNTPKKNQDMPMISVTGMPLYFRDVIELAG